MYESNDDEKRDYAGGVGSNNMEETFTASMAVSTFNNHPFLEAGDVAVAAAAGAGAGNRRHQNEIAADDHNSRHDFERNVENISVKIGQHASLPCFVPNTGSFKVQKEKPSFFHPPPSPFTPPHSSKIGI